MRKRAATLGFSLIELLLVLAIIGILSGIAIPAFIGQRHRARLIGDAQSNAKVIQMMLESRKADLGIYGAAKEYTWVNGEAVGDAATLLPAFTPKGNSKMDFKLTIANAGLSYTLSVSDPAYNSGAEIFSTDQAGHDKF